MDFKTFKKKLLKNGFSKWAFLVLAALTAVFLLLGLFINGAGKKDAKRLAEHKEDIGAYPYLDVAAFDEWVCTYNDETYYVLFDSSGEAYLSVVSDGVMKKMERKATEVEDYTHYFDENYRMYGLVKSVNCTVFGYVEDVYGLSDDQYVQYFGKCYFNTTENPNTNTAWMWWTFSTFSGIFAAVFCIIWLGTEIPFRKETRDYSEEEFAEAARMLDETDKKQNIIFGENYLISRGSGILVRYSDIVWIHLVDSYYNGVYMGRGVRVHTRKRNSLKIYPRKNGSQQELTDIMNTVSEKNPEVLVGYSKENKKMYDSLTKN